MAGGLALPYNFLVIAWGLFLRDVTWRLILIYTEAIYFIILSLSAKYCSVWTEETSTCHCRMEKVWSLLSLRLSPPSPHLSSLSLSCRWAFSFLSSFWERRWSLLLAPHAAASLSWAGRPSGQQKSMSSTVWSPSSGCHQRAFVPSPPPLQGCGTHPRKMETPHHSTPLSSILQLALKAKHLLAFFILLQEPNWGWEN